MIIIPPTLGEQSIDDHVSVHEHTLYLLNYTFDLQLLFFCVLPVAMARSCCGSVAICYLPPVLWMMSLLRKVGAAVTLEQPA